MFPIEKNAPTSLANSVYNELRRRLVKGELKPGQRLPEIELSAMLGVSRTPVREAIKRLESEGFAAYVSRRGAVVCELTPEQAAELYAVREILEGAAANFAARFATVSEIDILDELILNQREAGTDPVILSKINRQFHQMIYLMAHNRYLLGLLSTAQDYMLLLHETTYFDPGRPESALIEHTELVNAIKSRDSERAEAAARKHIREAQRIRMKIQFGM
jgi:DNA-binding GntR family transcriptional regulator